ncbi:MAG TPA: hypothetical protein EYN73_00480 [Chromatiaceae bacterium]|nr:hypothetical protein [Chromatiaceae bacterium]HIN81918.1 hypothetical protein [Chromatiales bacterium]
MSELFAVLINGVAQLEYNRASGLPDDQLAFLRRMDERMDAGITLAGDSIAAPDLSQKAQFVAMSLIQYIKAGDEAHASAFCSWLATRLPELKQLRVDDKDGQETFDLVFDREYKGQIGVELTMPGSDTTH